MSNLNIQKITSSLSGLERAKMMALDLDEKMKTNKETLTKEERETLLDFQRSSDYYAYAFYWDLKQLGATLILTSIELSFYKFNYLFLMLIVQDEPLSMFKEVKVDALYEGMQTNLNSVYTFRELGKRLSDEFDFPVLGEYQKKEIEDMLKTLDLLKDIINYALSFVKENDSKNEEMKHIKPLEEPTIDIQLVEGVIEALKRKMPKV